MPYEKLLSSNGDAGLKFDEKWLFGISHGTAHIWGRSD